MRTQDVVKVAIYLRRPRLAIGVAQVLETARIIQVVGRTIDAGQLPELIATTRPDVVVLDGDWPDPPLMELCKKVRDCKDVGIVLLTLESHRSDLGEAVTAGVDSVVRHPFHPRDLVLAVVHAALRLHTERSLAILQKFEGAMRADSDMITSRLRPMLEWALSKGRDGISPRLK